MKNLNLIFLLVIVSVQFSQAQVFCSKHLKKVLFGPNNVIVENSDPSEFYIAEINFAIENLSTTTNFENRNSQEKSTHKEDIKTLKSIRDDWIRWSKSSNHERKDSSKIEVKEFFDQLEIQNPDAMKIRGGHSLDRNCLYSNPDDCLFYGRIKKWKIKIEDDFGNLFVPHFHAFTNVGFESQKNGSLIFYRERQLEAL